MRLARTVLPLLALYKIKLLGCFRGFSRAREAHPTTGVSKDTLRSRTTLPPPARVDGTSGLQVSSCSPASKMLLTLRELREIRKPDATFAQLFFALALRAHLTQSLDRLLTKRLTCLPVYLSSKLSWNKLNPTEPNARGLKPKETICPAKHKSNKLYCSFYIYPQLSNYSRRARAA